MAWQDSRDNEVSPHALSSRSSSSSLASSMESKPSLITTWQVVQAQDNSQACSISIWLSSKILQTDVPSGASLITAPSGQTSGCGNTVILGINSGPLLDLYTISLSDLPESASRM